MVCKDTAITAGVREESGPPARSQSSVNSEGLEEGGDIPEVCLKLLVGNNEVVWRTYNCYMATT